MSNEENDKVINDIYYNEAGYGSVKTTYADARLKYKRITLTYVQDWFSKTLELVKQPGGTNNFIAPEAFFEYQVDLFFVNDLKKQKFRVGMCCVDIFSKYAAVVPLMSKDTGDVAAGILQCIKEMGKNENYTYR